MAVGQAIGRGALDDDFLAFEQVQAENESRLAHVAFGALRVVAGAVGNDLLDAVALAILEVMLFAADLARSRCKIDFAVFDDIPLGGNAFAQVEEVPLVAGETFAVEQAEAAVVQCVLDAGARNARIVVSDVAQNALSGRKALEAALGACD